jgi:hypothetical protein
LVPSSRPSSNSNCGEFTHCADRAQAQAVRAVLERWGALEGWGALAGRAAPEGWAVLADWAVLQGKAVLELDRMVKLPARALNGEP